jgi:hypothetical protein
MSLPIPVYCRVLYCSCVLWRKRDQPVLHAALRLLIQFIVWTLVEPGRLSLPVDSVVAYL